MSESAANEVSVDGGLTWHPAVGRASWTYTFLPKPGRTLLIRALLVPLWRGYAAQNLRNVADYTGPSTRSR